MNFSIIIPWFGQDETRISHLNHLLDCLSIQDIPSDGEVLKYEILIVEQNSAEIKEKINIGEKTKLISLVTDNKLFNKSWCMNVGAKESKYDDLIFMDADSLLGKDFLLVVRRNVRESSSPYNKLMFCWNYIIALYGKDNPISRHIRPDTTMAMGGAWYCYKDFYFNEFGGMNENYFGYGGEDNDAYERARYLFNNSPPTMNYPLAHQYHDWVKASDTAMKFVITREHPKEIIERLLSANLGNKNSPTIINMEDF